MKVSLAVVWILLTSILARTLYADPQADYMLRCQGCHLPDGSGYIGKVPSLATIGNYLRVPGGREFLIQVPGTSQSVLNDTQTAGVLNWILNTFAKDTLPKDFQPYTGTEVSRVRKQQLDDVVGTRQDLLARIQSSN